MKELVTVSHFQALSPTVNVLAEGNPALVYLSGLGSGSRRTMRQALNAIAEMLTQGSCDSTTLPWWLLRYQHTSALRSELMERYSPATANKMLSALRGVLRECRRLGLISADDYMNACDLKQIASERLPTGRALSGGEIAALMDACCRDASPAGFRDAAMLAFLMAGLRRSEVVKLDVSDFNVETGEIKVLGGKGRKDRLCYTPGGGAEAIADWLQLRGDMVGALLNPVNKGGAILVGQRLSSQAVLNALEKRSEQGGVKNLSPHDFRRTFISDLLDAGADISTVQRLAGHSSPLTTSRYDRRGEETKRRAVSLLHLPYGRTVVVGAVNEGVRKKIEAGDA
ncbi:tyrosine-type recombinase/integrase [Cyanobacteria bacterium FACHB-472]|nr:tyrosine-type recombinase/integrase [Cyanobacteria bacterium FACHB-472]